MLRCISDWSTLVAVAAAILCGHSYASEGQEMLPKVAIIMTGGTIAERTDPETGASVPVENSEDIVSSIPELKHLARYEVVSFSNIDSSQMTPEMWAQLSKKVDEVLEDESIIGAVITHGTDTMAEGAFFLDLTLKTDKSVVFTGAMKNASDPYPDGPQNVINSVAQVVSSRSKDWGVTINMNQIIHSSMWAEKTQTTNPQTFMSGEKGFLGYVFGDEVIYRYNVRLIKKKLPIPERFPKVVIIPDYAGVTDEAVRCAVDHQNVDGIVVVGVGSGNVSKPMYDALKYALSKGVTIVVTTIVPHGGVIPVYGGEGGGASLEKMGMVLGGAFNASKARLLLMLALPAYKGDHEQLSKTFEPPFI